MLIAVFVCLNIVYHWIKNWNGYPAFVLAVLIVLVLTVNGAGFLFNSPVVSFPDALSHFSSLYFSNADALSWAGILSWAKVLLRWLVLAGIFVSLMYCRHLKSEYHWMMVLLAVLFVYFYNPFAVVGVSTFLTGEVYTRFASLADSYAVLFLTVSLFFLKKPQRFLGTVMMCLMLLVGSGRVITEAKKAALFDFNQVDASMLMYRIDDEMMELGLFLNQYSEERLSIVYPKTINRFMLMTDQLVFSDVMPSFSQMRYDQEINFQDWTDNSLRNQIQAFLMAPELYFTDYYYQFDPQRVPDFQNIMVLSNTDLFVISKWKSEESHQTFDYCLQSFSYLIYESDMYQVYRIYR